VEGKSLSESELAVLKAEDDKATVTLDGVVVEIEQNSNYSITLRGTSGTTFEQFLEELGAFESGKPSGDSLIGATIYQHGSYGGQAQNLQVGNYDLQNLQIGNDSLSSLQVSPGFKVTLYEHSGYTGSSRTFTESTTWVGDFNDKTSSIKVEYINSNDTLNGGADNDNLYGGYGNNLLNNNSYLCRY